MINKIFCSVGEENGVKCLKIEKNNSEPALNKWNQVLNSIKYHIKKINNEKFKTFSECTELPEVNFNDGFNKIKFISDDSLRQDQLIYFATLAVVIRCIFEKGDLFYPQIYLDDALYQLLMISYEKITGNNKNKEGIKGIICYHYYLRY